jgi:cytochrome c556
MKTFAKFGAVAAAVSVGALAAGVALAQGVTPAANEAEAQAAVEARQELFTAMGEQMDSIAPMLRRQAPFDAAVVKAAADEMAMLTTMIPERFAVDTSGFGGLETEARNNIWQSHDAFLDKQHALVEALANLQEVAAAGEQGPTLGAVGAVGRACGSCHDDYRND